MCLGIFIAVSSSLLISLIPVSAKPRDFATATAEGKRFNESFDDKAKVSGTPLAGVRFGRVSGKVKPTGTLIAMPEHALTHICVQSKTKDGRYNSFNPYKVNHSTLPQNIVLLEPITKSYSNELSEYDAKKFAIFAFVSKTLDCSGPMGVILPEISQLG